MSLNKSLWASTFTSTPVFPSKIGSRYPNKPEIRGDVVEATSMDWRSPAA
jgi:hypothetical protein